MSVGRQLASVLGWLSARDVLATGFVAANVLASVASSGGVPQVPRTLHLIGTISGSALYLEALVDASVAFLSARKRPRDPMERAMPV